MKQNIAFITGKKHFMQQLSHIIVQPGSRNYHNGGYKYRKCHCVHMSMCICVCVTSEIAGCHAVSDPLINDISCQRGPTLLHYDSPKSPV